MVESKKSVKLDCYHIAFMIGFKVSLSGLRQFLATESPLKIMKNAFCFKKRSFPSQDI